MSLYAMGPCPCPKLMESYGMASLFAKLVIEMKGSEPGERMNRMGVWGVESGYILWRSKGKARTN